MGEEISISIQELENEFSFPSDGESRQDKWGLLQLYVA